MGAGHAVGFCAQPPCSGLQGTCACIGNSGALQEDHRDAASLAAGVEEIGINLVDDTEFDASSRSTTEDWQDALDNATFQVLRHRLFSPHSRAKFHSHYRIERLVGEGSYGNVYEAVALHGSDAVAESAPDARARRVAVKCFTLARAPDPNDVQSEAARLKDITARRASFERERSILSRLEHPHIVRMFECFEEHDRLWLVMELCRGGEVYECVANHVRCGSGAGLPEPLARTFFQQMLHAVTYLHSWQIVHRDVKTENFLLVGTSGSLGGDTVKMCDFGTAVVLSPQQPRAMERIGTLSYTAPEVYNRLGATTLADIWSLGVVLYVMLMGASPFRITGDEPQQDTIDRIARGFFDTSRPTWQGLMPPARDLICRVLVVDERTRLTGADALRHPWVTPGALAMRSIVPVGLTPPATARQPAALSVLSSPGSTGGPPWRFYAPRRSRDERARYLAPYAIGILARIGEFSRLDPLQRLFLTVCAQRMSEAELPSIALALPWYEFFFALDVNEDGRVDFPEFVCGMRMLLGPSGTYTDSHLTRLAQSLDSDHSGAIDWLEWIVLALLAVETLPNAQDPLCTAFRALDRPSHDGILGLTDLLAVVSCIATDDAAASDCLRELVRQALSRWSGGKSLNGGSVSSGPVVAKLHFSKAPATTPSLCLADARRALSAVRSPDIAEWIERMDSNTEVTLAESGWLPCCATEAAEPNPLLQQERVFVT